MQATAELAQVEIRPHDYWRFDLGQEINVLAPMLDLEVNDIVSWCSNGHSGNAKVVDRTKGGLLTIVKAD